MTNELTRPLTGAEERLWQEKLAALLVRQIALYTANESSSVPAAAARELLRGVLDKSTFGAKNYSLEIREEEKTYTVKLVIPTLNA